MRFSEGIIPDSKLSGPVLEFIQASFPSNPGYETELEKVNFQIGMGEILAVDTGEEIPLQTPLADAAQGLIQPAEGEVKFMGQSWGSLRERETLRLRGLTGRVSPGFGVLNNLDLDENVTLPGRYHGYGTHDSLLTEADKLAKRFGLREIPRHRPAAATKKEIFVTIWIRAFLGPKKLVILEYPTREVDGKTADCFMRFLKEQLCDGKSLLFITGIKSEVEMCKAMGARLLKLRNRKLVDEEKP